MRRKSAMSVAASSSTGWSAVGPVYDPYATAAKNGDQHGLSPFDHSFSDSSSAAASGAVSSSSAVKANFLTDQEGGGGNGIRGRRSGNGNNQLTKEAVALPAMPERIFPSSF